MVNSIAYKGRSNFTVVKFGGPRALLALRLTGGVHCPATHI